MKLIKANIIKLKENELNELGKERASAHNKLLKHQHTIEEYYEIFSNLLKLLIEYNVEPIVVVFPATSYYRSYFCEEFKTIFYKNIEKLSQSLKFALIDLFENNEFGLDDYVDFDHLNKNGAAKVTHIVNEYL
jgi:hypothetical protein